MSNKFFILLLRQEILWHFCILDLKEPSVLCLFINQSWIFLSLCINGYDLPVGQSVDISCNLNTLYHQGALLIGQLFANGWEFNMNDLS